MVQDSKHEKVNKGRETEYIQDTKKVHRKSQCHLHTLKSCGEKRHVTESPEPFYFTKYDNQIFLTFLCVL